MAYRVGPLLLQPADRLVDLEEFSGSGCEFSVTLAAVHSQSLRVTNLGDGDCRLTVNGDPLTVPGGAELSVSLARRPVADNPAFDLDFAAEPALDGEIDSHTAY